MKGISAIILAAGQGKRMKSSLPKVAHLVSGNRCVARRAGGARRGDPRDGLRLGTAGQGPPVVEEFGGKVAIQESQFGTGDAARCGLAELSAGAKEVVVLCGDARSCVPRRSARSLRPAPAGGPGIGADGRSRRPDRIRADRSRRGRIGRQDRRGERRERRAPQGPGSELGDVRLRPGLSRAGLPRLSDVNAQREYYLTDLVLEALAEGKRVVPWRRRSRTKSGGSTPGGSWPRRRGSSWRGSSRS